jgi:hypothetical protein
LLTNFPGRTTRIHVFTHNSNDTTVRVNGTLLGSNISTAVLASHVSPLFFDHDLISEVESIAPYSLNTQGITLNSEDSILVSEVGLAIERVAIGTRSKKKAVERGLVFIIERGTTEEKDYC